MLKKSDAESTAGDRFLKATTGEQLRVVQGYLAAMDAVASTLKQFRDMFTEARRTRKMTDEEIGCLIPDFLTELLKAWDFESSDMPNLVAHTIAIYKRPENKDIGLASILEVARDWSLRRITNEQANEALEKLRS